MLSRFILINDFDCTGRRQSASCSCRVLNSLGQSRASPIVLPRPVASRVKGSYAALSVAHWTVSMGGNLLPWV